MRLIQDSKSPMAFIWVSNPSTMLTHSPVTFANFCDFPFNADASESILFWSSNTDTTPPLTVSIKDSVKPETEEIAVRRDVSVV